MLLATPLPVQLLHFHPSVLEPDLHLSLGQTQNAGHLVAPVPGQIHVVEELLLQLQSLIFSVRASVLSRGARVNPVCGRIICKIQAKAEQKGDMETHVVLDRGIGVLTKETDCVKVELRGPAGCLLWSQGIKLRETMRQATIWLCLFSCYY